MTKLGREGGIIEVVLLHRIFCLVNNLLMKQGYHVYAQLTRE